MNSNSGDCFDGVSLFVAVVEAGSFTSAAERFGQSPSHVSKTISRLETRIGARLLNRTTRTLSLTDAGREYFERCRQMVADATAAEAAAGHGQESPSGSLRVSAPVSFALGHLNDALPDFLARYPDLTADIELNDRMVDLVAEGFDTVIRIGDLKDSSLVSRRIASSRGLTVAAPDYWDRRGRPAHPSELAGHDCITYSYMARPDQWQYRDPTGGGITVKVTPRIRCNSAELEAGLAAAGLGVTRLPAFACARALSAGRLEPVLEAYEKPEMGIYALYPHRRHLTAKVRVFIDFLVERFGD